MSSAIISASVALIVVALSHWTTSKRQRVEHLIAKLEELYRLVGQIEVADGERYEIISRNWRSRRKGASIMRSLDDMYCHRRFDELRMYARLYFPRLEQTLEALQDKQVELNESIGNFAHSDPVDFGQLNGQMNTVGIYIRKLHQEMVDNHALLVGKLFIRKRYRRAP